MWVDSGDIDVFPISGRTGERPVVGHRAVQPDGLTGALTVVIPVWGRYVSAVPACVASLRTDSRVVAEILLVRNASAASWPRLPGNVRVITTPTRMSLAETRNYGLAHVATPFVAFLDADDEAMPGAYSDLTAVLRGDPGAVAAAGSLIRVYPDGRQTASPWPSPTAYRISGSRLRLALRSLRENCYPTASGSVLRTETLRAVGGFGAVRFHEDWALSAVLPWLGRVHLLTEPAAFYHYSEDSRFHQLTPVELDVNRREVQSFVLSHPALPYLMRRFRRRILRRLSAHPTA